LDAQVINQQWGQIRGGLKRARPWFELCRLPWSLAVAADPLAGALVVGAKPANLPSILPLMLGAVLLHAGAVAMNDWHDFKSDRVERPERPLPMGTVGKWSCLAVAIVLLSIGWGLVSAPGMQFGQVGLVMVCTILVYEFLLKGAPVAKLIPGVSRALGLLAGMLVVPVEQSRIAWSMRLFLMGVLAVYCLAPMVLACRVADEDRRSFAVGGLVVAAVAVAALAMSHMFFPALTGHSIAVVWIGLLIVTAGVPGLRAILRPGDAALRSAAAGAMFGTILVDASAVAFVRGLPTSLLVILILVPVVWSRHWLAGRSAPSPNPQPEISPEESCNDRSCEPSSSPPSRV
jgi:4-hydroxybenzoate polyprenyltransferase